ncbi:MAG: DUF4924 family protein [Bacteroidaceae bacterium]|nr:DUF4924 family protein [Bacteroidaceae bacterium]
MKIAHHLKETNIAEYILYMFQLEDTLRAYDCDPDRLADEYVSRFDWSDEDKDDEAEWLSELCIMMQDEGKTKSGHLLSNLGTISLLTDLHLQLLESPKQAFYKAAYYKALPYIVEFRAKSHGEEALELQNCFDMLYAVMLLRLQKREISKGTQEAVAAVSQLIALLARAWKQEREGTLEIE